MMRKSFARSADESRTVVLRATGGGFGATLVLWLWQGARAEELPQFAVLWALFPALFAWWPISRNILKIDPSSSPSFVTSALFLMGFVLWGTMVAAAALLLLKEVAP